MRNALLRTGYRVAYRLLQAVALVRPPRGRGAKCLLVNRGEVLLVRHTYGPPEWELPGGGARRHERVADAMRREVREELGVEVTDAIELGGLRGPGRHGGIVVGFFAASLADRALVRPDSIEIAHVAWFDPARPPQQLGGYAARGLALLGESLASRAEDPGSPPRG